jgi:hypothetical protein
VQHRVRQTTHALENCGDRMAPATSWFSSCQAPQSHNHPPMRNLETKQDARQQGRENPAAAGQQARHDSRRPPANATGGTMQEHQVSAVDPGVTHTEGSGNHRQPTPNAVLHTCCTHQHCNHTARWTSSTNEPALSNHTTVM